MDYYVATKLEIYRKCLVIGKYTDQKKKKAVIFIYSIISNIQNAEKGNLLTFPNIQSTHIILRESVFKNRY